MARHQIQRVRHEVRRRSLTIAAIEPLTPKMLRMRFTSPDLHDFNSASPDDHIKLFFPSKTAAEGDKPPMRDFTPRSFNTAAGELTVDFAIHDEGPATEWATSAKVGDTLEIVGPRGSSVIPDDFDWYLLVGDETALPSICRRVEATRAEVSVATYVIMGDDGSHLSLTTNAVWSPTWLIRTDADDADALIEVLKAYDLPAGDGFVWIAAEAEVARRVKQFMVEHRGHDRAWIKAAGYWQRGEADAHVKIED